MQHGDFTHLAQKYALYRPGYAPFVLDTFLRLCPPLPQGVDAGAGTGIWTRMLAAKGAQMTAVEPNDAMREAGQQQEASTSIQWRAGSAEHTGLPSATFDFVTMASSFHWPDFNASVAEFSRILKPGGLFMALWNTRRYESNPLLVRIENKLHELVPHMQRISSGRSTFCEKLMERLRKHGAFKDVLYLESQHIEYQTPEHYKGLWESVNDVRVQAGEERFAEFLQFIHTETINIEHIEATYTTRAWIAQLKD